MVFLEIKYMDLLNEKWEEILQLVKTEHELSEISFKTWLKPLQINSVSDDTVYILVPSEQMGRIASQMPA